MLLRARIVLPVCDDAIEDGAIRVVDNKIAEVGRWSEVSIGVAGDEQIIDLGDSILLPGLINAHCHLDYSGMAGQLPPPRNFPDWIKGILALKAGWSYSEYATSWVNGAKMLAETGTTTVGDIEAVPELLAEVWREVPIRVTSFLEMTGVKSNRPPSEIVAEAVRTIDQLSSSRHAAGLSPHSLYSTSPELIRRSSAVARERDWLVASHVSESIEEFEMFTSRKGSLYDWLKPQRDMSDCSGLSPVQQLEKLGALNSRFLAVHVNYLADGDAATLSRHGVSIVHCPRSHEYFGHRAFPLAELERSGANICLGTDSLASVLKGGGQKPKLSMFDEMSCFARKFPDIRPDTIVRMATTNGSTALGNKGTVGELAAGTLADIISIPYAGPKNESSAAVLHHRGPVSASMVNGEWLTAPAA
jgi:cytosine/adenosine deaminase-related metal-dependent hydrolase